MTFHAKGLLGKETICQDLFSEKNKKYMLKYHLLLLKFSLLKVNYLGPVV